MMSARDSNLYTEPGAGDLYGLPKVSVDIVPIYVDNENGDAWVYLTHREEEPFSGTWTLPGVLLRSGETLAEAGKRAILTKTEIREDQIGTIRQLKTFDAPNRDPRGHTLSVSLYVAVRGDGSGERFALEGVKDLPFDHDEILAEAKSVLARDLLSDPEITKEFLGERFTTPKPLNLIGVLTGKYAVPSNFFRKLERIPFLEKLEDEPDTNTVGRPPQIWAVNA